jgi:hypothetical protein
LSPISEHSRRMESIIATNSKQLITIPPTKTLRSCFFVFAPSKLKINDLQNWLNEQNNMMETISTRLSVLFSCSGRMRISH